MTTCAAFLLFAADSLGRRRSLLWTSIAQGTAMYYIGLYVRIAPPVKGADIPPAGYVALVCIFLFAGFFQVKNPLAPLINSNSAVLSTPYWFVCGSSAGVPYHGFMFRKSRRLVFVHGMLLLLRPLSGSSISWLHEPHWVCLLQLVVPAMGMSFLFFPTCKLILW